MSQHYRGRPANEKSIWRFHRQRWQAGSALVLDIDDVIVNRDVTAGLLIEWKHIDEGNRDWRVTRKLAQQAGLWSALFIYELDDGG